MDYSTTNRTGHASAVRGFTFLPNCLSMMGEALPLFVRYRANEAGDAESGCRMSEKGREGRAKVDWRANWIKNNI